MGACFRLRGGRRRAKPPAVLAGDGDFAPAIFCAAKESHRKTQARWMARRKGYGKASLRKGGAQKRLWQGFLAQRRRRERGASNVRCLPALHAQRSHIEKRRLDG